MNKNVHTRDNLITKANAAFMELTGQVEALLDAAQFYIERYPVTDQSTALKLAELCVVIKDLGALPSQIATEISRWKKKEERVLSRLGVETQLLNELYATIEVMMWFFIRENIDLPRFYLSTVKVAYITLADCNRRL